MGSRFTERVDSASFRVTRHAGLRPQLQTHQHLSSILSSAIHHHQSHQEVFVMDSHYGSNREAEPTPLSEDESDEDTVVEVLYAHRVNCGSALNGFNNLRDIRRREQEEITGEATKDEMMEVEESQPQDSDDSRRNPFETSKGTRNLLTLPSEIRERIWRHVVNNLNNDPDEVHCQHFHHFHHGQLVLVHRPMPNRPHMCPGFPSSVKSGHFPNVLLLNHQVYAETAKLLYSGRRFYFCKWINWINWSQQVLARDKKAGEKLLSKVKEVVVDVAINPSFCHSYSLWMKVIEESVEEMSSENLTVTWKLSGTSTRQISFGFSSPADATEETR